MHDKRGGGDFVTTSTHSSCTGSLVRRYQSPVTQLRDVAPAFLLGPVVPVRVSGFPELPPRTTPARPIARLVGSSFHDELAEPGNRSLGPHQRYNCRELSENAGPVVQRRVPGDGDSGRGRHVECAPLPVGHRELAQVAVGVAGKRSSPVVQPRVARDGDSGRQTRRMRPTSPWTPRTGASGCWRRGQTLQPRCTASGRPRW